MEYNGWKNYETWNCALWMANDSGLYQIVLASASFDDFLFRITQDQVADSEGQHRQPMTPDMVAWADGDRTELIECFEELRGE